MKLEAIVQHSIQSRVVKGMMMVGIVSAISPLTSDYWGELGYHLSAAGAYVAATLIDHLSTIPLIKLMNTEEFQKKELQDNFKESSFILGKHPTMEQYLQRSTYKDIPGVILTTFFPNVAYAYLAIAPLIYGHNRKVERNLRASLSG